MSDQIKAGVKESIRARGLKRLVRHRRELERVLQARCAQAADVGTAGARART